MNKLQKDLKLKVESNKGKFFEWFNRFVDVDGYWEEKLEQEITRNVSYSGLCNEWLESILFYSNEIYNVPKKFLLSEFEDMFNKEKLSFEEAKIIQEYFISRFVVSLIAENKFENHYLESSIEYYELYLKKRGYSKEKDLFTDADMSKSYILADVVPSGMVRYLLGMKFDDVKNSLDSNIRTFDMIWSYAWRLLKRIDSGELNNIQKHWKNFIVSWKKCFVDYEFHGFSESLVVLLYCSYCKSLGKEFLIEELIDQIIH